ncbi:hypothetical protein B0A52_07297 [Exophiala mesophila]|uniref:Xylanolytic transcriptional activator regulatory domain-containing protein n=1 Tax=Exophiala mesophila TaxID=212818 RepID=A0A438MX75_EXOME|nr:hypothetical protein B0A52_07297 [Exophiala mesophila]
MRTHNAKNANTASDIKGIIFMPGIDPKARMSRASRHRHGAESTPSEDQHPRAATQQDHNALGMCHLFSPSTGLIDDGICENVGQHSPNLLGPHLGSDVNLSLHDSHTSASFQPSIYSEDFADSGLSLPDHTQDLLSSKAVDSANWLLTDDFDFSIFDDINHHSIDVYESYGRDLPTLPAIDEASPESTGPGPEVADLRHLWYTPVPSIVSGFEASQVPRSVLVGSPQTNEEIDEEYRASLANKLQPPIRNEPLPSIELLNLCIHMFFKRFNLALPLVHAPTFRPTTADPLLVLSICSAGALSMGSAAASKTGCMLFERVHKAQVGQPLEKMILGKPDKIRATMKASMVGQTFALLSAHSSHLYAASSFHGTLISGARHARLYHRTSTFELKSDLTSEELINSWHIWARREELKRLVLAQYIHDAELAALFHHEPIFRHHAAILPEISSSALFEAPSAQIWAQKWKEEHAARELAGSSQPSPTFAGGSRWCAQSYSTDTPMLVRYALLSGIAASIAESRHLKYLDPEVVHRYEAELIHWHNTFSEDHTQTLSHSDLAEVPFSLKPLWHYTFMTLTTDLDMLERAVGKDGSSVSSSVQQYVYAWISSPDSKRCLYHALKLQQSVSDSSVGAVTAIHTPRILFAAAVCWQAYIIYRPHILDALQNEGQGGTRAGGSGTKAMHAFQVNPSHTSMVAIGDDGDSQKLDNILATNAAEMKAATLCILESTLRRLGSWGISRSFADLVRAFIFGTDA